MANNAMKVETNDLKNCANKYETLAKQYEDDLLAVGNKLSECQNYWQGSFASDFDAIIDDINKVRVAVYDDTTQLAKFLEEAANLYEKYDGDIARALQDNPALKAADYPDGVVPSVHVLSQDDLLSIYQDATKAAYGDIKNTDGSVSCSALTRRKAIRHGFLDYPSRFAVNGRDVVNTITDTNTFSVTKYSGADCLTQLITAEGQPITDIVVSFDTNPSPIPSLKAAGHVLYIDQIVDGKVYYSDNNRPYEAQVKTIDEFLTSYKPWNGAPSGCAHLKKKV